MSDIRFARIQVPEEEHRRFVTHCDNEELYAPQGFEIPFMTIGKIKQVDDMPPTEDDLLSEPLGVIFIHCLQKDLDSVNFEDNLIFIMHPEGTRIQPIVEWSS